MVDHLKINFSNGLCALTGETGAGKSILLNSLGLALGNRSDAGLVRKGQNQAQVIATFDLQALHPVLNFLKEHDIEADTTLILKRSVSSDGRSKAFVNNEPVSIKLLKQLGDMIVEIHGQFETQNLFNTQYQLSLLDEYAENKQNLEALRDLWERWSEKKNELDQFKKKIDKAREEEEYFRSSLEDLDGLSPKSGEEEVLSTLRQRLMRREQILGSLHEAEIGLQEIETLSGTVWKSLNRLEEDGKTAIETMERANTEIQEVISVIHQLSSDIDNNEYSLEEIDDRLFSLKTQAKKHNCTIEELPKKRDEIFQSLNAIEEQDQLLEDLIKENENFCYQYTSQAEIISNNRKKYAEKLSKSIIAELSPLKLEKTIFEINFEKLPEDKWSAKGFDKIEFLVATNAGANAGPLNKIASGGEMSRLMLAIKVVLAQTGIAETLVFDEVDSGIGGATAAAVGERLAELAKHNQVLVVTHSPQVAAMAQNHWIVMKEGKEITNTNIIALSDYTQRQEEIARMLAGADITEEARAAADKLLEVE